MVLEIRNNPAPTRFGAKTLLGQKANYDKKVQKVSNFIVLVLVIIVEFKTLMFDDINIGMITSDNWGSYTREVPKDKHLTGKIFTQRIERNNLTLRTRIKRLARKTICSSRSTEVHEKVIGSFIEKYMFY